MAVTVQEFSAEQDEKCPASGEHGDCPASVREKVNAAFDSFDKYQASEFWENAKVDSTKDGIVVKSVDPETGRSVRRFLTAFTLVGATAEQVDEALLTYRNRRDWDKAIDSPVYLRRWSDSELSRVDAVAYTIKATGPGGMISGRAIADVLARRKPKELDGGLKVIEQAQLEALPEELPEDSGVEAWRALANKQKLVHARNLTGGGVRYTEREVEGKRLVDVSMVSSCEFGGWTPAGILNSATGNALIQLVKDLAAHLPDVELDVPKVEEPKKEEAEEDSHGGLVG